MTEAEMKKWIDAANYEQLLRKWRFAPSGDPFFQGDIGKYYTKAMAEKRKEIGSMAATEASNAIGW